MITAKRYSFDDIFIYLTTGCVFQTNEAMLGAFWFFPVMLVSCILFSTLFSISYSVTKTFKTNNNQASICMMSVFAFILGGIGIYANTKGMFLAYHIQTAFLAVPVMFLGWIVKKNVQILEKICSIFGCTVSSALLFILVHFNIINIELSENNIGNVYLFYPATFLGIYFCLCLASLLKKTRRGIINRLLVYIGQNSFYFMAFHFLVFKIIDKIISSIKHEPESVVSVFPHSYDLGLLYSVITIILICVIISLFNRIKSRISTIKYRKRKLEELVEKNT